MAYDTLSKGNHKNPEEAVVQPCAAGARVPRRLIGTYASVDYYGPNDTKLGYNRVKLTQNYQENHPSAAKLWEKGVQYND